MKKKRTPAHDFEHIGGILQAALKKYRKEFDVNLSKLWDNWEEIVGGTEATNSRPVAFNGRILIVHVSASPWLHHMQFIKQDMIVRINKTLGKRLIDDIKFKVGTF